MEETIYSNELLTNTGTNYFKIEARNNENFIRVMWIGFINIERAKNGINEEVAAIEKTGRSNFLVDNRAQIGPFPRQVNQWAQEVMIPKINTLGGARFAQILSKNVFTEISAKSMEKNEDINNREIVSIANFENEEDALKWLNS